MSSNHSSNDADARAARNRKNAEKSTGPRTPEGKQRASQNALKHGLYARSPVIRGEDAAAREQLRHAFADDLRPFGATEWEAIEDATDAAWRKRRFRRIEAEIFERAFEEAERTALGLTILSMPAGPGLGSATALDGEFGRQFSLCMRAGARASREYREAIRDLQIMRRARDKGGQSWHESQQARWGYEMDKNTAPSSWVHPDAYFIGADENAERHPADLGRGGDPATSAANPPPANVNWQLDGHRPDEPAGANLRGPAGSLVGDSPHVDAGVRPAIVEELIRKHIRFGADDETKPTPPVTTRGSQDGNPDPGR